MRRFIVTLMSLTIIGLFVVGGEVEALKSGYKIRQLNLTKLKYRENIQKLESQIAQLKTPGVLEERMVAYRVKLSHPKVLKIAKIVYDSEKLESDGNSTFAANPFARFFVGTAKADNH